MSLSVVLALFGAVVVASILAAPKRATVAGFFAGSDPQGTAPGLWVLVLSQVTTWIFARSLMNAAILGYYYGIWGVLAYGAYYGSFLSGGFIVGRLREAGAGSVQDWLGQRFGPVGQAAYDLVVALRLLSEVFANLLVVGLIFAALLPEYRQAHGASVVIVAALGLVYSAWGGLSAALRSDVVQMLVFLLAFGAAFLALLLSPGFSLGTALSAPGVAGPENGQILLLVAFLQVFSYPAHDPVMMDRGFLADPETTRRSFLHAFWISLLCILGFGLFGIEAGLAGAEVDAQLLGTWAEMFPGWVYLALVLSLLVSALSTLDSALASAARLAVDEWGFGGARSLWAGRLAMAGFAGLGAVLTLWGNQSLFDAVAVSGTASMFLTPVLIVGLVQGRQIALWAYLASFAVAMAGALTYVARDGWGAAILPEAHKYSQLLSICVVVLVLGFACVLLGRGTRR